MKKIDFPEFITGYAAQLAASVTLQIFVALAPFFTTLISLKVVARTARSLNPELLIGAILLLAVGWSLNGIIGAIWFRNHTKRRSERTQILLEALFIADHGLNLLIADSFSPLQKPDIETRITMLLLRMCDVLAYRIDSDKKGASLLILTDDTDDAAFELFAQVRHDEPIIAHEITQLSKYKGFAGQALRENKCLILRDCRKPPKDLDWINTHTIYDKNAEPRYIGRAAAPIQAIVQDKSIDIGVLCFDIKQRWTLSNEDQILMEAVADKISQLWIFYQPNIPE